MNHVEMMRLAEQTALKSVCKRAQVGAVLAHHLDGDRYVGWNLRPCGGDCEGEDGRTLPDVIHAEVDVINSAYTYQADLGGWVMYVTRQPCIKCAQLITQTGIKSVYYRDADDKMDGLHWLRLCGISVFNEWIDDQPQAVLERVQRTWAERWQEVV